MTGGLRSIQGVLPMVMAAAGRGIRRVFVPEPQVAEAMLVPDIEVFGARSLRQVVCILGGEEVPADPARGAAVGCSAPQLAGRGATPRARSGRCSRPPRRTVRGRGSGRGGPSAAPHRPARLGQDHAGRTDLLDPPGLDSRRVFGAHRRALLGGLPRARSPAAAATALLPRPIIRRVGPVCWAVGRGGSGRGRSAAPTAECSSSTSSRSSPPT